MKNLQEVFNEYTIKSDEAKGIKKLITERLKGHERYQEVKDNLERWGMEKKQIKAQVEEEYTRELEKLDSLKIDIDGCKMMMSDIALSELIKGNVPEVEDSHKNKQEPVFSVTFKKT